MGLSFLTACSQTLLVELVVPRMGHSGPVSALASFPASRGEEGRPRKTPGPGDALPQALRRLATEPLGCRDFAAGEAVAFEPKPRPPALSCHAGRRPRAPPRVPQTSRGADLPGRVRIGVRWGPGRDPPQPRAAPRLPAGTHPARSVRSAAPRAAGPSPSCALRPGRLRGGAGPSQGGAGDTAIAPPP